jgi:predicted membrane protein
MGQSSYTYIETSTGYKGWIESGNSLSAILIMSLFIMLQRVREKKITILVIVAVAAYLITTIGTRTGLLGTFIAVGLYLLLEMFFSRNKKIIIAGLSLMTIAILVVVFAGSKTIQRRQQMNQSQYTIIDEATGEVGNMTGDMLRIKNKILNNTLEEGYMSEAQKQSVLDLHEYTKSVKLAGNDTRTQQLMYNIYLMKNQHSFTGIVFGNGYNNNEREMRMENELASLFLNFGLCGFILYACPILAVLVYAIIFGIKRRKEITLSYVMNVAALMLAIGLSWLSGYVLFATSSMTVIVVIATLLLVEIKKIKKSKDSKIADAE